MGDAEGKEGADDADTPQYVEQILLNGEREKLMANVLKIAHHGSETSSTLPFIEAVDPDIVITQSGRKPFGGKLLPVTTKLERYCAHNPNVKIYRTDKNDEEDGHSGRGAADGDYVIIQSNGTGQLRVRVFESGEAFNGDF
jgi:hypothetical protein